MGYPFFKTFLGAIGPVPAGAGLSLLLSGVGVFVFGSAGALLVLAPEVVFGGGGVIFAMSALIFW